MFLYIFNNHFIWLCIVFWVFLYGCIHLFCLPKVKYITLGPKFYTNLRSTITRRRKHLFQYKISRISSSRSIFLHCQNVIWSILGHLFEKLHATLDSQLMNSLAPKASCGTTFWPRIQNHKQNISNSLNNISELLKTYFKIIKQYFKSIKAPPANPKMSLFEKCFKSCFDTSTGM